MEDIFPRMPERARDHVQHVVDQWTSERPDLDPSPILVIGRLHRVANALTTELVALYAKFGLGEGDYDVLASLRRQGHPFLLTPTQLLEETMVTSGAVSKRVDRLAALGLVERVASRSDGRSTLVHLTAKGRRLMDEAIPEHLANEERLLSPLTAREQETLATLLAKLGASLQV